MDFNQFMLVCCCLPSLVLLAIGLFILANLSRSLKALTQFTAPDTQELHQQYEKLKTAQPNDTNQQLVQRIINRYALRQGIVGALTSVGGFIGLPIGLTIDLFYSAKSNTALSYFIAQVYGIESEQETLNVFQLMILKQKRLSADEFVMWQEQFMGLAYKQMARSVLQKTLAKIIPGAGAIIGFAVNWSSAQLFGRIANTYYSRNIEDGAA